eukprot:scaffold38786_cov31-Tisochrysis_lutea.AAC.4
MDDETFTQKKVVTHKASGKTMRPLLFPALRRLSPKCWVLLALSLSSWRMHQAYMATPASAKKTIGAAALASKRFAYPPRHSDGAKMSLKMSR